MDKYRTCMRCDKIFFVTGLVENIGVVAPELASDLKTLLRGQFFS